jgi:hypothetical protein
MTEIPVEFNDEFLDRFRERTEAFWATYEAATPGDYVRRGSGGSDWQRDTYWLNGLSDHEIDGVERRWSLRFPQDYRLLLGRLHSVDRPMTGAHLSDPEDGHRLVPDNPPSFYNWLTDTEAIRGRFDWLVEGLQFDVEHNVLWRESWGPKPSTLEAQKERVRALVAAAPKLVPVFAHRYLLAEPCQAGNPVLSVYESDIIVYGYELRSYFLMEFYERLGLEHAEIEGMVTKEINARFAQYEAIPFWGELLGA